MDQEDKKYTYAVFKILREIIILKTKDPLYSSKPARLLHLRPDNPNFRKAIKILKEENLCKIHQTIGNIILMEINRNKLEDFIRKNCKELKRWGKFIERTVIGFNY